MSFLRRDEQRRGGVPDEFAGSLVSLDCFAVDHPISVPRQVSGISAEEPAFWSVDPDFGGKWLRMRPSIGEAFGMKFEGRSKDAFPLLAAVGGSTEVDIGGGEETEGRVHVLFVVPADEVDAEGAGVLDRAESVGEIGPVLEGLEV